MSRRSWLALALAAGTVPGALAGCGGAGSAPTRPTADGTGFQSVGSRQPRAAADRTALAPAVTAVQDFAADAFRALAGAQPGNLVMSPLSVHLALGMTVLGARGRTATEMLSTLHAPDAAGLARGLNALTAALAARAGTVHLPGGRTATVQLEIAGALWGQQGLSWAPGFLDALAADFGAGMRVVDFAARTEPARQAINGWVGKVTRNTIPQLIVPGQLRRTTLLALVNALYLKAPWAVPFPAAATAPGAFTRADGTRVTVPLMRQSAPMGHGRAAGCEVVRLGYVEDRLAMTLILPGPGRAADVVQGLDGASLRAALAAPTAAQVELTLPRWRTRTAVPLNDLLAALGMRTAFTAAADFSGMTTTPQGLSVGAVLHQGYVSVDEQGTEASAATAVMMESSALARSATVAFDRPFLYVLTDGATKAPLFVGRVADPSAG